MMNTWRLIKNFWNKGRQEKKSRRVNQRMGWNIYDPGETYHQHQKNFWHIHYVFKYKLFMPLVILCGRVMGKYLKKKVPEGDHNVNIRIFKDSFERSIHDWAHEYMKNAYPDKRDGDWAERFKKNYSCQTLRLLRDVAITGMLYDTAYREFFNIFAHNFSKDMASYHTDKGTRDRTGHLFFTHGDVYDVDYYMLFKKVEVQRYMSLKNLDPVAYADERKKVEEELKNKAKGGV